MKISEYYKEFKESDEQFKNELLNKFDNLRTQTGGEVNCPFYNCRMKFTGAFDLAGHIMETHKGQLEKKLTEESGEKFGRLTGENFKRLGRWATVWAMTWMDELNQPKTKTKTPQSTKITKKKEEEPLVQPTPKLAAKQDSGTNFNNLSRDIRNSSEISETWKGIWWSYYIKKHAGLPPCYVCHEAEATQIHHSSIPFHEILLGCLRKLGLTAQEIQEARNKGDETLYVNFKEEVAQMHGKLLPEDCLPVCEHCNTAAEQRRKLLATLKRTLE